MFNRAVGLLTTAQVCLFAGLITCLILRPSYIGGGGGLSNYGIHLRTVIPFSLAFGLCGLLTLLAARRTHMQSRVERFAPKLYILGGLFLALLLSTYVYKRNNTLRDLHIIIGSALILFELFFGFYLYTKAKRPLTAVFLSIQLLATLLSALSLMSVVSLLAIGQLVSGACFAIVLITSFRKLTSN